MEEVLPPNDELLAAFEYHKSGQYEKAEVLYKKITSQNPYNDLPLSFYAILCAELGRTVEAADLLKRAIKINPNIEYFQDLINILQKNNDINEAQEYLNTANELYPENISICCNLAIEYLKQNKTENAVACLEKGNALLPDNPRINHMLGFIFYQQKAFDQSLNHYLKVLDQISDDTEANMYVGNIYLIDQDFDKAIKYFNNCINSNPEYFNAYNGLAMCYLNTLEIDTALKYLKKVLEYDPNNAHATYYIGYILILKKDFKNAWESYDVGRINYWDYQKLKFPEEIKPKWNGEPINGKTIYVYETGGIGDTIQYARYLPELVKLGAKVICKQHSSLENLFRENYTEVQIIKNSISDNTLEFDYQIPYMSFGRAFNANFDNIPHKDFFIRANQEKVQKFKADYFNNNYFKLGIVWSGSKGNLSREIDLNYFFNIAKLPNLKTYSLQKESSVSDLINIPDGIEIINLDKALNDFNDTSAAVENLDLLISIDTAILHLGGALGKKTWGLIPYLPDWRYFLDIDNSPWYNSVKLFRQKAHGDWSIPIQNIYNELSMLLSK